MTARWMGGEGAVVQGYRRSGGGVGSWADCSVVGEKYVAGELSHCNHILVTAQEKEQGEMFPSLWLQLNCLSLIGASKTGKKLTQNFLFSVNTG